VNMALEDVGWGTADHWMPMQTSYELAQARRDRTIAGRRGRVRPIRLSMSGTDRRTFGFNSPRQLRSFSE